MAWAPSERRNKMGNPVGSLSEVQHAIVIGTLLGDGSMRCKTNALLEINHSSDQKGYVDWKYSHLADLVSTPPKADGRKQVPSLELPALALAVWFMYDGCRSRNAVYLNTQQFDGQVSFAFSSC